MVSFSEVGVGSRVIEDDCEGETIGMPCDLSIDVGAPGYFG